MRSSALDMRSPESCWRFSWTGRQLGQPEKLSLLPRDLSLTLVQVLASRPDVVLPALQVGLRPGKFVLQLRRPLLSGTKVGLPPVDLGLLPADRVLPIGQEAFLGASGPLKSQVLPDAS